MFSYLSAVCAKHIMILICSLDFKMFVPLRKNYNMLEQHLIVKHCVLKKPLRTTRKINLFRCCFLISHLFFFFLMLNKPKWGGRDGPYKEALTLFCSLLFLFWWKSAVCFISWLSRFIINSSLLEIWGETSTMKLTSV